MNPTRIEQLRGFAYDNSAEALLVPVTRELANQMVAECLDEITKLTAIAEAVQVVIDHWRDDFLVLPEDLEKALEVWRLYKLHDNI